LNAHKANQNPIKIPKEKLIGNISSSNDNKEAYDYENSSRRSVALILG
jgi:hypothetical protein